MNRLLVVSTTRSIILRACDKITFCILAKTVLAAFFFVARWYVALPVKVWHHRSVPIVYLPINAAVLSSPTVISIFSPSW